MADEGTVQVEGQTKVTGSPELEGLGLNEEVTLLPAGQKPPQEELGGPPVETPPKPPPVTETPQLPENKPPVETPPETPPVVDAQTTAAATPPVETPPEVNPWETVFGSVKKETGVQFQSEGEFMAEIKAYQQYKQDPNSHLPAEIKAHADFLKAGGDTTEFYRLKSLDFNAMSDSDLLFQSFLKDNPEEADNLSFARKLFDRDFKIKYQTLLESKKTQSDFENDDQEPDQVAYQEYNEKYDFAQEALDVESKRAKTKLSAWQEQATTPPSNQKTGMTQEEAEEHNKTYLAGVEQVKTSFTGEELPVSDKPEENLKIGLSDPVKIQWEKDLVNPMELFKDMGLQENGMLDMNKLSRAAFIFRSWPDVGRIISKLTLEGQNRETITGSQVNPTPEVTPSTSGSVHGDDEEAEAADLILQQMQNGRG